MAREFARGVFSELEDLLAATAYRSMMAMKGETSPEAHAAAVKSDVTLHGKSFVFQDSTVCGNLDAGSERARGEATMFGEEERWALSAKAVPRPSWSMLRVIP